jgi:DNA-binding NarL/FixJ family response regulator
VFGSPRDAVLMRVTADTSAALREAALAAAEAAARARSLAVLLDEAVAALTDGETVSVLEQTSLHPFPPGAGGLSPREQEVLALVAAGHTNKAIAEALFVSPNTVKTHVASLLQKLRVDSRVQLAAMATTYGLRHYPAPVSR